VIVNRDLVLAPTNRRRAMTKLKARAACRDSRSSSMLSCRRPFIATSSPTPSSWHEHRQPHDNRPVKLIAPMLERFMAKTGSLQRRGGLRHQIPGDLPWDFRCASAEMKQRLAAVVGDQRALKVIGSGSSRMGRNRHQEKRLRRRSPVT